MSTTLRILTQSEIDEMVRLHKLWRMGDPTGQRFVLDGNFRLASSADLSSADLSSADLRSADLRSADLSSADLRSADLSSANLSSADLSSANLSSANLRSADLRSADLSSANLSSANLRSADLRSAELEDGVTWEEYVGEVVPVLCTAGGKTLEEVSAAWECHSWLNCPMKVAFGIESEDEAPAAWRFQVRRFVRLFDARLIPNPLPNVVPNCAID